MFQIFLVDVEKFEATYGAEARTRESSPGKKMSSVSIRMTLVLFMMAPTWWAVTRETNDGSGWRKETYDVTNDGSGWRKETYDVTNDGSGWRKETYDVTNDGSGWRKETYDVTNDGSGWRKETYDITNDGGGWRKAVVNPVLGVWEGYRDIYSPITFRCTQEFVLVTFHSYSALGKRHNITICHV